MRPCIVYPFGKKYIILGGNMRYQASKQNLAVDVPCIIMPKETSIEKLKEIVIKDNGSFGNWDYDELANKWDDLPLTEWGVPVWNTEELDVSDIDDTDKPNKEKDEKVEALLNDAMRENVIESMQQMDLLWEKGWIASFITRGLAQAKFIRAKFYGEHYPQWVSLYFCPDRFKTSANERSCYEQMKMIAARETDAGIAGLRTLSEDHLLLLLLLKGSYPFGGARMPLDFPANLACDLIKEFAGKNARVLDPCHGWGGRLCGALMADAKQYVGIDPSAEAHAGLERMADAFLPYSEDTSVEFIQQGFEDVDLSGREFDMAITSPPYFDVEQYHGEGQAHIKFPQFDLWVEGFYRPLIKKTYDHIRKGGVFCLQVGSQTYPILDRGKKIAQEVGFKVEDIRPFGGSTSSKLHSQTDESEDNEKIIILRK
jgi:hypothetical protein